MMTLLYAIPNLIQMSLTRYRNFFLIALICFAPRASFAHPTVADTSNTPLPKCFYLSSYTPGYAWQDDEESALFQTLHGHCQLQTFYMDTKHILAPQRLQQKGIKAHQAIQQAHPDILIASDDNAMKYVIMPYYKNASLPVVFCGINNSGKSYGLPYQNTTGMIEKMPFIKLMEVTQAANGIMNLYQPTFAFLTAASTTEKKNVQALKKLAEAEHARLKTYLIHSQREWIRTYRNLNQDPQIDFIILGNAASLKTWHPDKVLQTIQTHTRKLTLSYLTHMRPYVHISIEKSASEQGHWAGLATRAILEDHYKPNELNIVPNQVFPIHFNLALIHKMPPSIKPILLNLHSQFRQGAHSHED